MRLKIKFHRNLSYLTEEVTLLLFKYFSPTKLQWESLEDIYRTSTVYIDGADPIDPFHVMKQIVKQVEKHFPIEYTIEYIEMESTEEKEKVPTWILMERLDS